MWLLAAHNTVNHCRRSNWNLSTSPLHGPSKSTIYPPTRAPPLGATLIPNKALTMDEFDHNYSSCRARIQGHEVTHTALIYASNSNGQENETVPYFKDPRPRPLPCNQLKLLNGAGWQRDGRRLRFSPPPRQQRRGGRGYQAEGGC